MNGKAVQCVTFEGRAVVFEVAKTGLAVMNERTQDMNEKLHRKYQQEWFEELTKLEDIDIEYMNDNSIMLWGADTSLTELFTAFVFA